jgi:putative transposase
MHIENPEKEYPQVCFNYIHQNPIKAKMVKLETDWEFSSASDYAGRRNGKLIKKEVAKQYIEF